jgi:hypothetical protein
VKELMVSPSLDLGLELGTDASEQKISRDGNGCYYEMRSAGQSLLHWHAVLGRDQMNKSRSEMARTGAGELAEWDVPVSLQYEDQMTEAQMCMLTSLIQILEMESKRLMRVPHAVMARTARDGVMGTPEMYSLLLMIYSRKPLEGSWTRMVWVWAGTAAGYPCPALSLAGSSL